MNTFIFTYCTMGDQEIHVKVPLFQHYIIIVHKQAKFMPIWNLVFKFKSKFNDIILNDFMATSDCVTKRTSMKGLFHHC